MKRTFICLVILFFTAATADARTVELTLHPTKAAEQSQRYRLLPKPEEQSDSDALPLYKKAIESLPENFETDQIGQWVKTTPLNKLPRKQVQSTLQRLKPSLQLVEQAANCKKCNWPDEYKYKDKNLNSYRKLANALALQARLQIVEGQYNQAIGTMQTGLTMGKYIGQGPTLIHGLVGVAISAVILNRVEDLIQIPDAPNLCWALKALPKPLVDLTKQMELEGYHERVHQLMNRLDSHVAALQCVEAMRLYAGAHDGKFPNKLSEITQVTIPSDPVSKKPFIYRRSGSEAVLEGPSVKGINPEDMISYKLTLKK